MWLTRLSITRPITIMMLVLTLLVFGIRSYTELPVELYPDVNLPVVIIMTTYQGAGPEEIENTISKPIEDQMSTISGLDELRSTSSEAMSMVIVVFRLDINVDQAVNEVRDKMDMVKATLPDDAGTPLVIKIDPDMRPIVQFALTSSERSQAYLKNLADDVIVDKLRQQPGVASVSVYGGDTREIQIVLDPGRLAAYGVTQSQVTQALAAENLNVPAGTIKESETNYSIRVLGELQDLASIADVKIPNASGNTNLTIGSLMVSGSVADTFAEKSSYARHNGDPGVAISIQRQSKYNTVDAVNNAYKAMEELTGKPFLPEHVAAQEKAQKRGKPYHLKTSQVPIVPKDINIAAMGDQSVIIKDSLDAVVKSLIEGALLAVLIVFLFLHSLRSTFIVALAIPISMVATFAVMDLLNFSINLMSMLALSLSVGILVDDSIVVIENINRHLKAGDSPADAAFNGRMEIGLAAMIITLVDVVVFVPIAMASGFVGMMFREFGITVAVAALFSLFVSFTVTPMLSSRWLVAIKKKKENIDEIEGDFLREKKKGPKVIVFLNNFFGMIFNAWERGYTKLNRFYANVLAWSLDHRAAVICLGLMIFLTAVSTTFTQPWYNGGKGDITPFIAVGVVMFLFALIGTALSNRGAKREKREAHAHKTMFTALYILLAVMLIIPTRFSFKVMPEADQNSISITVRHAVGTNINVTDQTLRNIENDLANRKEFPDIKHIAATVGTSGGFSSNSEESGSIAVDLNDRAPFTQRFIYEKFGGKRPELRVDSSQDIASAISQKYKDLPGVEVTTSTSSGMGGGMGGGLEVQVRGNDMEAIKNVSSKIETAFKDIEGTSDVEQSWRSGRPEVQLRIDRERAAKFGLTVSQVASAMRVAIAGDTSQTYREAGEEYDIRIVYSKDSRSYSQDIGNIIVGTTSAGTPVYASEVTTEINTFGPAEIARNDRMRTVTVSAKLLPGYAMNVIQAEANKKVAKLDTSGTVIHWGGESEDMQETFIPLIGALALSIMLVVILMCALFENLLSPLIVLLAVPQAIAGAIFAMSYTNTPLSVISLVGIIMLVGLVSKNSILLVDYTNTLRSRDGMDVRSALLKAGPIRMQPILMTTMAMVFGMLPTALSFNAGAAIRQPLGVVVIGGLILSMFLSLLMVPAFYEIMDNVSNWITKAKNKFLKWFEVE